MKVLYFTLLPAIIYLSTILSTHGLKNGSARHRSITDRLRSYKYLSVAGKRLKTERDDTQKLRSTNALNWPYRSQSRVREESEVHKAKSINPRHERKLVPSKQSTKAQGDIQESVNTHIQKASFFIKRHEYQKATSSFEKAVDIYKEQNQFEEAVKICIQAAIHYVKRHQDNEARNWFRKAASLYEEESSTGNAAWISMQPINLFVKKDSSKKIARLYTKAANIYANEKDCKNAEYWFEMAIDCYKKQNELEDAAELAIQAAVFCMENSKYQMAVPWFTEAANLYKKQNKPEQVVQVYIQAAILNAEHDKHQRATSWFMEAANFYDKQNKLEEVAQVYMRAAKCCAKIQPQLATPWLEKTVNLYDEQLDSEQAAQMHIQAAMVYLENHHNQMAAPWLERAAYLYAKHNQPQKAARVYEMTAQLEQNLGNSNKAHELYNTAKKHYVAMHDMQSIARIHEAVKAIQAPMQADKARRAFFIYSDSLDRLQTFTLIISRNKDLFVDSCNAFMEQNPKILGSKEFKVQFKNEKGLDTGGLTREWLILFLQEAINNNLLILRKSHHSKRMYGFNPSKTDPDSLTKYMAFGRIIAIVLREGLVLPIELLPGILRGMLNLITYFDKELEPFIEAIDLQEYDHELHERLIFLLALKSRELSAMEQYFDINIDGTIFELVQNGSHIQVDMSNRKAYIALATKAWLRGPQDQLNAFLKGFGDTIYRQPLKGLGLKALKLLLISHPQIDPEDWKANTEYTGYRPTSPQIEWFWEIVFEMALEDRLRLLQFATASTCVPIDGFAALKPKFNIQKGDDTDMNRLIEAHTCVNRLVLPQYKTKSMLRERVYEALKHLGDGFGFL